MADLKMAWMTRPWRVVMVGPVNLGIAIDDILTLTPTQVGYRHPPQPAMKIWGDHLVMQADRATGMINSQPFEIVYSATGHTLTCTMKSWPLGRLVTIVISAAFLGTAAGAALAALLGLPLFGSLGVAALAAATAGVVTVLKSTSSPVPIWVANDGGAGGVAGVLRDSARNPEVQGTQPAKIA